ncbi:hypothetical protein [Sulfolobus spindle-shaped virus 5]|uniref:Uncharacterized protein n=1 Tax=Sulfolobus spindle-shaped virus 5 TaxID=459291 RepID=B5KLF9_9VIRU|nr:hypothetical protein SSSV5_gp14 [Sulfolobus spindle-shaped virus 5]ABV26235.1 hypothetical protein [Sulfolobus spindle-shaped virus 5]
MIRRSSAGPFLVLAFSGPPLVLLRTYGGPWSIYGPICGPPEVHYRSSNGPQDHQWSIYGPQDLRPSGPPQDQLWTSIHFFFFAELWNCYRLLSTPRMIR